MNLGEICNLANSWIPFLDSRERKYTGLLIRLNKIMCKILKYCIKFNKYLSSKISIFFHYITVYKTMQECLYRYTAWE